MVAAVPRREHSSGVECSQAYIAPVQALQDLLLNVAATVIGIFVVYALLMPRLRVDDRVRASRSALSGQTVYNCAYRNRGPFTVYDVRVQATLRIPVGLRGGQRTWQLMSVPVDDPERPVLARRKKQHELPRLLLDEVDWSRMPAAVRPTGAVDLAELLETCGGTLNLHVACTASVSQVNRVFKQQYGPQQVRAAQT